MQPTSTFEPFRLAVLAAAFALASCSDHLRLHDETKPEAFEKFVTNSIAPPPKGIEQPRVEYGPPNQGASVARGYEGTGTDANPKAGTGGLGRPGSGAQNGISKTDEGFRLSFNDIELSELARIVLGDSLKLPFAIDPAVKGTVTVETGKPVSTAELLTVLELLLDMNQVALVKQAGVYQVMPAAEAKSKGAGAIEYAKEARNVGPGYGVTIMPLRYVSASTLMGMVQSVAAKPGALGALTSGNMVIVRGTAAERRDLLAVADMLDVDWMKGRSAGIFPLANATTEAVMEELEKILETNDGGRGRGLTRLQPIERLNAVLVLAETPDMLHDAATWIKRLDVTNQNALGYYVYRVENGKARDLALVLNQAFGNAVAGRAGGLGVLAPGNRPIETFSQPGSGVGGGQGAAIPALAAATGGSIGGSTAADRDPALIGANSRLAQVEPAVAATALSANPLSSGALGDVGSDPSRRQTGQRSEQVRVIADEVNNKLLIYANGRNFRSMLGMLRSLDKVPVQVLINATLAEVTLNDNLRWGVQVFLRSKQTLAGSFSEGSSVIPAPTFPGLNFIFGYQVSPKVILDALAQETHVRVLSSPAVVVVNNQTARLQVGDQVPVSTQSAQSVLTPGAPIVNSIEFRDTGVILKVTPRINSSGLVTMEVQQEISAVVNAATTLTPTISQRRVSSTISVYDGHMVVLGGLMSESRNETQDRIPIWEKVPLLGEGPGTSNRARTRSELVVFIQPRVIRDPSDATGYSDDLRLALGQIAPNTREKYKRWTAPVSMPPGLEQAAQRAPTK